MQRSVRGLLGTLVMWSGPSALVVWAASASRLSLAERTNSHGLDLVLGLAMAAPLTAPLGSWLRRGSRWTPTARWHRRRSRSLDQVSVYDLALCLGLTWSVLGIGGSAVALVRTCARMWSEARELSAGRVSAATIAGAVLLGVCAAAVAILAAVLHLTLFFGFWRRTVWGRCRRAALVEPAQQELQLLMEPLPSRAMTAYAAGLVVLFVCLTVIAGSIVYQSWVAPSAKPLYVPQFGSG